MVYNIEISFNVIKNGNINKLLDDIRNSAENSFCENFYEDYEFENKTQFQRRHCIVFTSFSHSKIKNMIEFLNNIRKNNSLYIELIYDDDNNSILYASEYFISQKMDKYISKNYRAEKRKRSYSDDESMILKAISK